MRPYDRLHLRLGSRGRGHDEDSTRLHYDLAARPVEAASPVRDSLDAGWADRVRHSQACVDRVQCCGGREGPPVRDPHAPAPGAAGKQLAAIEQCPDVGEETGVILGFPGRNHGRLGPVHGLRPPVGLLGKEEKMALHDRVCEVGELSPRVL